jgi:asparagine synthase (glutamine-hydrolysing)
MCGIAGIVLAPHQADPRRLAAVRAMAAALRHRGPDGDGFWHDRDAGVALAHRRLAIVDLSAAGRQPMLSHGRDLVMTFNGEIYNFVELRSKLEALGHRFHGHSDTEVMLAAFESWGIEPALRRFAGMFAIGLWDRKSRTLHLIRDRLGKKPLYVTLVNGALVFASELKAIQRFPGFRPTVDPAALSMVLRQGWVPDRHCIWKDVFKLPPGTMLSVRLSDIGVGGLEQLKRQVRSWWSLAEVTEAGQQRLLDWSTAELETELDRLLRLMVRQRMVADVPLGAFLSGGIDSSTVVALMQAQAQRPVRTFTVSFSEAEYDEGSHASQVARHLGTEHTEFRLSPSEALAVIPDLPVIWDEPFADESQIPTFLLARLARQYVTVALSGDGGDECFGGYMRHVIAGRLAPIFRLPVLPRRMAASTLLMLSPGTWDSLLRAVPLPAALRPMFSGASICRIARVLDAADDRDFYERISTFDPAAVPPAPDMADTDEEPRISDPVGRVIYRDMAGYLPGDILVKLDRASMANSLEGRCPFLDHRLIEFAWRLPPALKVRDGQGKWLLRRVLRRYLPERLFERPKQGFNVPIGEWLRVPLRDWAEGLLDARRIEGDGLLDSDRVRACWQEHLDGRADRSRELWAILMVQAWLDSVRNIERRSSSAENFESAAQSQARRASRNKRRRAGIAAEV